MPASRQTSRFFAAESTSASAPRRTTRSRAATVSQDIKPPPTRTTAPQTRGKQDVKKEEALDDIEDFGRRTSKRQRVAASNAQNAFAAESSGDDASESDAVLESSSLSEDDYESDESVPRRSKATGTSTKRKVPTRSSNSNSGSTPRKAPARKPARSVIDAASGAKTTTPPSDWKRLYDLVLQMRRPGGIAANAAVDTMGCERLADRAASPRDQRFHTLIALMLSSQTKDTVNAVVMKRLQTELPGYEPGAPAGLNLENVLAVDAEVLNQMIWAVGFHNNKTKYIKQAAEILRDKWNGDIPDSIAGLTSLPGVGPKMAHLCLSHAWHRTEGIGVDVHVHRLTNMWGWHKTSSPEETRLALQAWLPHDKWAEINWLLVGFGQTVCPSSGKNCGACEVGLEGLCRAADRKKIADGRKWLALSKMKEEEEEEEEQEEKQKSKVKDDVDSVNMALKKEDAALEATAANKSKAKQEQVDSLVKIKDEQD